MVLMGFAVAFLVLGQSPRGVGVIKKLTKVNH